jgi:hypothetical protein
MHSVLALKLVVIGLLRCVISGGDSSSSQLRKVLTFQFIWSHRRPFEVAMDIDYVSIARCCYVHSSDGCPSLLWSLVAMDVADVSFRLSLLTLWAADVKTVCRYYDASAFTRHY